MEKNNKNTNEKEIKGMQKTNRMSRLSEYRDRILDLMENLDDLMDDIDALQEDMEEDLKEQDSKQSIEVPFPDMPDEEDVNVEGLEMTVTFIVPDGSRLTLPVDILGGKYEH